MDRRRISGAIVGLVAGIGLGIVAIFYFHLQDLSLAAKIGMPLGLGMFGGLLGGVFGLDLF